MADELLEKIIEVVESELQARNAERREDGIPLLKKGTITILGQFSLFADDAAAERLPLAATMDLDATLSGDASLRTVLVSCLAKFGLIYDELSEEIWIPPGATFHTLHESELLLVRAIDAIYALVCKAVKAPAKNRILVREALGVYGEELRTLIKKHGGNVEYFLKGAK